MKVVRMKREFQKGFLLKRFWVWPLWWREIYKKWALSGDRAGKHFIFTSMLKL